MIEPRLSLLHVHHRRALSSASREVVEANPASEMSSGIQHDEPERPIHPALEYEVLVDCGDEEDDEVDTNTASIDDDSNMSPAPLSRKPKRMAKLLVSFVLLFVSGTGTVMSMKLQAAPLYNYPNFLNLLCHFLYIPLCFLYIIPMIRFGSSITPEQMALPRTPFIIMGALDSLASTMQMFASFFLPGPLLIMLPQAVIPCCMFLSYVILNERYHWRQYLGAFVVLLGLFAVMVPVWTSAPEFYCEALDLKEDCTICQLEETEISCLSHVRATDDTWLVSDGSNTTPDSVCQWLPYLQASQKEAKSTIFWSITLLLSAIPMTFSTIYKQVALDVAELDPVYLNGWISIFQFLFALIVGFPAAYMINQLPSDVPGNMLDGLLCFFGKSTIDSGCHPDACSPEAPLYVGLFLVCATVYSVCMLCVLKYGSTSSLFLAQTLLIPVGNLAFSITASPLSVLDIVGLVVVLSGLSLYRFWGASESSVASEESGWLGGYAGLEETPWYLDMVRNLQTTDLTSNSPPWFTELLQHMREPLLESEDVQDANLL